MDVPLVVLEVELVQAVVGWRAVTVVVGVAGGVKVRLLLDSLPVSALRAVDVRLVLLEAGELSVAPEADVRMVVGNGLRPDIWEKFLDRFGIRQMIVRMMIVMMIMI